MQSRYFIGYGVNGYGVNPPDVQWPNGARLAAPVEEGAAHPKMMMPVGLH